MISLGRCPSLLRKRIGRNIVNAGVGVTTDTESSGTDYDVPAIFSATIAGPFYSCHRPINIFLSNVFTNAQCRQSSNSTTSLRPPSQSRWNSSSRGRIPRISKCQTLREALDVTYDNLDILSPRDVAEFWAVAPALLQKQKNTRIKEIAWGKKDGQIHPQVSHYQFDTIANKTMEEIETYSPRELAITSLGLAKMVNNVRFGGVLQDPKLFTKVADSIVSLDNLDEFKPHELSNIVWSFASMKESHPIRFRNLADASYPSLFQKLADAVVRGQNEFKPQEISITLWAFASNGHTHQHLFSSLAQTVKARLREFSPQLLVHIAWSYAVANVAAPTLFNKAFVNACSKKRKIDDNLIQLHQWQLWQEELKSNLRLPPYLQKRCLKAFISQKPKPSALQDDVISQLKSIGLEPQEEVLTKGGYRLDALVEWNGKKVGVEVDGPSHFLGEKPTGSTILKRRQVTNLDGIQVVSVPYWEWNKLGKSIAKKQKYLQSLFTEQIQEDGGKMQIYRGYETRVRVRQTFLT